MYRLLVVTQDARTEAMFASMEGWEAMGFKPVRIRNSVEDAIACMGKHHIDAIAFEPLPVWEPLRAYLDEHAPCMPIFEIAPDAQKQYAVIKSVFQLLCQLHSDHSNDDYDEALNFQQARERWLRKLLSGMVPTSAEVLTCHRMFRCTIDTERPCVYVRLTIPPDDPFVTGRWHYGSERLETAIRNFFGTEREHAQMRVAVVSPMEVRFAACPNKGESDRFDQARLVEYVRETLEQIDNYLGLRMNMEEVRTLDSVKDFALERNAI